GHSEEESLHPTADSDVLLFPFPRNHEFCKHGYLALRQQLCRCCLPIGPLICASHDSPYSPSALCLLLTTTDLSLSCCTDPIGVSAWTLYASEQQTWQTRGLSAENPQRRHSHTLCRLTKLSETS